MPINPDTCLNKHFEKSVKGLEKYFKGAARHHLDAVQPIINDLKSDEIKDMAALLPKLEAIKLHNTTGTLAKLIRKRKENIVKDLKTLLVKAVKTEPSAIAGLMEQINRLGPVGETIILQATSTSKYNPLTVNILATVAEHNARYALPILQAINQLERTDIIRDSLSKDFLFVHILNLVDAAYDNPQLAAALFDWFDWQETLLKKSAMAAPTISTDIVSASMLMLAARYRPDLISSFLMKSSTGTIFFDNPPGKARKILAHKSPSGHTALQLAILSGHNEAAEQISTAMSELNIPIEPVQAASSSIPLMQPIALREDFVKATTKLKTLTDLQATRAHRTKIMTIITDIDSGAIKDLSELLPRLHAITQDHWNRVLGYYIRQIERNIARSLKTLLIQAAETNPAFIPGHMVLLSRLQPADQSEVRTSLVHNLKNLLIPATRNNPSVIAGYMNLFYYLPAADGAVILRTASPSDYMYMNIRNILVGIARHNASYALPIMQAINQLELTDKRALIISLSPQDLYNLINAAHDNQQLAVALLEYYFNCLYRHESIYNIYDITRPTRNPYHPDFLMLAAHHHPAMIASVSSNFMPDIARNIFEQKTADGHTAWELAIQAGHAEGAEEIRKAMEALGLNIASPSASSSTASVPPEPEQATDVSVLTAESSVTAHDEVVVALAESTIALPDDADPLNDAGYVRLYPVLPPLTEEEEGLNEHEEEEILLNRDVSGSLKHEASSPHRFFYSPASATHKDNSLLARLTELTGRTDWTVSGDESPEVSIIMQSREEAPPIITSLIDKMDLQIVPNDKQFIFTGSNLNLDALGCSQPGPVTMAF